MYPSITMDDRRRSGTIIDLYSRALISDIHDRFLLVKPSTKPDGPWEMPGGNVPPGETCTMSIIRALRDDLGILTWPVSVVFIQDSYCKRSKQHLLSITYCVSILSGELQVNRSGQIDEARWFTKLEVSSGVSDEALHAINSRQVAAIMAS
ncbi:MAG: NUDIX domain-containing protein [Rhizobiaceae bacterium]|nr:NUDIX domain-containing protein [Rhizobiaceae bacterium]